MRRVFLAFFLALIPVISLWSGVAPISAQGTVYTDTMDSAESGLLSTDTWDPAFSFTYQNGQFVVAVEQAAYRGDVTSTLQVPGMTDSRLTVDASIAGDQANKYLIAGCRNSDAGEGYFFAYLPAIGELLIWRRDATGDVDLAWGSNAALISSTPATHQIGIDCTGNVITGMVDGQLLLRTYDGTYTSGRPSIGIGANGNQTDSLLVSFDNLTVTDAGGQTQGANALPPTAEPTSDAGANTLPPTTEPTSDASAATTPFHDPSVDPTGVLNDAFGVSLRSEPVVSELESSAPIPSNGITMLPAQVALADFYTELYYTAPAVPANSSFIVGFCFWTDAAGNCTDIYLQSSGSGTPTWGYGYAAADGSYQSLQTGNLPVDATKPSPGEQNFLGLTVYQGYAILTSNTFEADVVIPLEGTLVAGDVIAEAGFINGAAASGPASTLTVEIVDFAVWDLSSGTVPVAE